MITPEMMRGGLAVAASFAKQYMTQNNNGAQQSQASGGGLFHQENVAHGPINRGVGAGAASEFEAVPIF